MSKKQAIQQAVDAFKLDIDVLTTIFKFLDFTDHVRSLQVCKKLNKAGNCTASWEVIHAPSHIRGRMCNLSHARPKVLDVGSIWKLSYSDRCAIRKMMAKIETLKICQFNITSLLLPWRCLSTIEIQHSWHTNTGDTSAFDADFVKVIVWLKSQNKLKSISFDTMPARMMDHPIWETVSTLPIDALTMDNENWEPIPYFPIELEISLADFNLKSFHPEFELGHTSKQVVASSKAIATYMPNLTRLGLSLTLDTRTYNLMGDAGLKKLHKLPLTHLEIGGELFQHDSWNVVTDIGLQVIGQFQLRKLKLSPLDNVTDAGLRNMYKSLHHLEELTLHTDADNAVAELIHLPNLDKLRQFTFFVWDGECSIQILPSLLKMQNLKSLDIQFGDGFLREEDLIQVCAALKSLEDWQMIRPDLSTYSVDVITALSKMPRLTNFNCYFHNNRKLFDALDVFTSADSCLQRLDIFGGSNPNEHHRHLAKWRTSLSLRAIFLSIVINFTIVIDSSAT